MNRLKLIKQFVRFQHSAVPVQVITPVGKKYTYETTLNLPQQKVVDEIDAKYAIKDSFQWVKLNRVDIGRDGSTLTMKDTWGLSDEISEESIPKALQEVNKLIKFKEDGHDLNCSSCNIAIQSRDTEADGYFKIPKFKTKVNREGEFKDSESALINEFRSLAGVDPSYKSPVVEYDEITKLKNLELVKTALELNFQCERCKYISRETDIQIREVESIMGSIPKYKTLVYVCSMLDFPLGIDREVIRGRSNVIYLVNKSDLFYSKDIESQRLGVKYCKQLIEQYTGQRHARVILCSATKGWNVNELLNEIKDEGEVYFIGRANAGKSSIIASILQKVNGKSHVGEKPGIGSLPGYTRSNKKYSLGASSIIDTPGFTTTSGVHQYMLEEYRGKNKYPQVTPNDVKKLFKPISSKYKKVFNGKDVLTYGGVFYLQPPKKAVVKVQYLFNKLSPLFEAKYGSMKRAGEVSTLRPVEMGKRFLVKEETFSQMEQYELPTIVGNCDVVIQDFGVFSFQPTSSPSEVDGKFTIWVPRGVKVMVRPSIFKYIYRSRDGTMREVEQEHLKELGGYPP